MLIKSLSPAEKRHFKSYISRHQGNEDSKYMLLFNAIDSSATYNEESFLKKIPAISRQQLPNIKSHLYGEILVALRLLHSGKNTEIQIREQIDYARILYNRGLIQQALKILARVKAQARAGSHFIITLEILQFEKDIETRHITRSLRGRAQELIDETSFIIGQVNEVTHLSNIALRLYELFLENGPVKDAGQGLLIEQIFRQSTEGINERQVSFYGRLYLYQSYCWYYMIQLDSSRYYRYAEKWVRTFDSFGDAIREHPLLYIKAVHNLLNALFIIGKHGMLVRETGKLEDFYHNYSQMNENLEIQTFVYLYTSRINIHFIEGTFSEGLTLIPVIESKLEEFHRYIDTHRILVFYYKIACLYFGSGDNEQAIGYLNKVINLKVGQLRTDIQCFARLLHLIAHYELQNIRLVEYLIKSVYRFLSKMENLDAVLAEIFEFLKRSLSSRPRDVRQSFAELKDRLEVLSQSKYNRRSYQYLDIVSWLESKIRSRPVQEVIRQKFLEGDASTRGFIKRR